MKNINFLPPDVHQQHRLQAEQWGWLALTVFCGLAMAASAMMQMALRLSTRWEQHQIEPLYRAAKQLEQERQGLEKELEQWTDRANLYALLDASWPSSTLLAVVWEALPPSVEVTRATLQRINRTPQATAAPSTVQVAGEQAKIEVQAAAEDFQQQWKLRQQSQLVIDLEGRTRDSGDLHPFLSRLHQSPLITAARLESLKSDAKSRDGSLVFLVRIFVRPEFGLPGGPTGEQTVAPQHGEDQTINSRSASRGWLTPCSIGQLPGPGTLR